MSAPARISHAQELLDARSHDLGELEQSLGHMASINRWLGGTSAVLKHLEPLFSERATLRLLDIATGSADIPRAIVRWARRHNRSVHIVATDVHPQMLAIAARACAEYPEITVAAADALRLPYAHQTFDVALLSLALHHFDPAEQLQVLREMGRVSALLLVNDLERGWLNYMGARLLAATWWRANRLTRHDGPLSVLRSFTRAELQQIARAAELDGIVQRHFFQRVVLAARPR